MNKSYLFIGPCISILMVLTSPLQAKNQKIIYGADDRQEVVDYHDRVFRDKAESVAAMFFAPTLQKHPDIKSDEVRYFFDRFSTLQDRMKVCSSERFSDQPAAADCTGFLIGEDTLVTAGHCVEDKEACLNTKWVFGFNKGVESFSQDDVYSCRKILGHGNALGLFSQKDYAVLKLDRKVKNREPLEYRKSDHIEKGEELVIIGHPSGLPMKIADNAKVRSHRINFFYANMDAFRGNSGSPVFNRKTGKVEGILVRGRSGDDYVKTSSGCYRSRYKAQDDGKMMVHKMTRIPELED